MNASNNGKTVVLVHGAWMTPTSWNPFKEYFEAHGYNVIVPTWPYLDRPIDEIRKNPGDDFGSLSLQKIADHYEEIIRALPEPPLLIGHSMGGLVTQILLDRGVGAAGVVIDSAPIGGIVADFRSLASALPIILRPSGWKKPFVLTKEAFDTNFANTAPQAQRDADYAREVIPAPGRIFYEAAFSIGTFVDAKNRKQPLLVIAGEKDRTTAPALVRSIFKKQSKSKARTDYLSFDGVSHYLVAEPGWQKVAEASLNWADRLNA
ncbi:alpha/beta hydrolase [Bdellovibrio sp. HCB274]|uniref:alpha/beta hydrolase n=1 Tax=Bdellovibrio sp. HCB274 TaxID=3394361 RepID=UPI0039B5140E